MKWVYFIYCAEASYSYHQIQQHLADFGLNGWELVSVIKPSPTNGAIHYFKRNIKDE